MDKRQRAERRQKAQNRRFEATRSGKSQRLAVLLLCVVLVAVGGLVWYVLGKDARAGAATAEACARVEAEQADMGEVVTASEGSPVVAIVGDSYAAGDTLANRADAWSYQLGESEGWRTDLAAIGGTGFVNGGYCTDDQIETRVTPALEGGATTLIIQAGINDVREPAEKVSDELATILADTASVERVIVIGPTTSVKRPGAKAIDAAMREATEAANREYVSTLDWPLEFGPDELHMTSAGHADYAERVAANL